MDDKMRNKYFLNINNTYKLILNYAFVDFFFMNFTILFHFGDIFHTAPYHLEYRQVPNILMFVRALNGQSCNVAVGCNCEIQSGVVLTVVGTCRVNNFDFVGSLLRNCGTLIDQFSIPSSRRFMGSLIYGPLIVQL